jgi:FtsH-binding integral membrane protein
VNRIIAVLVALLVAVHVSIPALGMAAPLPILFAFAAVIAYQVRLIRHAAGWTRIRWEAGS